jgi:hypothetical protein
LRIFAPRAVRDLAVQDNAGAVAAAITPVAAGDTFTAGDFEVRTVGGEHAEVYEDLPGCVNLGFIVEGVYHPGAVPMVLVVLAVDQWRRQGD